MCFFAGCAVADDVCSIRNARLTWYSKQHSVMPCEELLPTQDPSFSVASDGLYYVVTRTSFDQGPWSTEGSVRNIDKNRTRIQLSSHEVVGVPSNVSLEQVRDKLVREYELRRQLRPVLLWALFLFRVIVALYPLGIVALLVFFIVLLIRKRWQQALLYGFFIAYAIAALWMMFFIMGSVPYANPVCELKINPLYCFYL